MKKLLFCILAFSLAGPAALAAGADLDIEGRYERITPTQPTADPSKVEVLEIFWYGCPHCNRFQPFIDPWQARKPEHVAFLRMPAIFRKSWEIHARAYYVSQAIGALDQTHSQMFAAIHKQRRKLQTKAALREFFAERGVSREAFDQHYDSFAVESKLRQAKVMQERYGIRGVPAVIVNGKYRVSGSLAGSYANVIKVIDALVDKEFKQMR